MFQAVTLSIIRSFSLYTQQWYFENDLLFLLPLSNDLWLGILGELPRQYKDFQVTKEDY